jgi:hypothetical protein
VADADFVLLETDIPGDVMLRLACLLYTLKPGSRLLSYLDLYKVWEVGSGGASARSAPFVQLDANKSLADRYPTSWSVHRGHHFFIWCKQAAARPHMFEHYTQVRRLLPDQLPPYPPYAGSFFRSWVATSSGGGAQGTRRSFFSRRPAAASGAAAVAAPAQSRGGNSIDVKWLTAQGRGNETSALGRSGSAAAGSSRAVGGPGGSTGHSVVSTGGRPLARDGDRSPPGTSLDLSKGGAAGGARAARLAGHRNAAARAGSSSGGPAANGTRAAVPAEVVDAPPRHTHHAHQAHGGLPPSPPQGDERESGAGQQAAPPAAAPAAAPAARSGKAAASSCAVM